MGLKTTSTKQHTTLLHIVSAPADNMALYLRYPAWAVSGATVTVNGKKIPVKQQPGSYITINRKWKKDDKVEITYPMSLRMVPTPDNPAKAAIAYGPVVLAAPMGTEGMKPPAPFHDPEDPYEYYTYDYHIPHNIDDTLNIGARAITDWIQPAGRPLTFKTVNAGQHGDVELKPYYRIHEERYIVYWNINK